jgi:hypothetical protein
MHWTRHGSQRWEQIPLPSLLSNMRTAHFVATKAWRRDIKSGCMPCLVLSCLVLSCLILSYLVLQDVRDNFHFVQMVKDLS